MPVPFAVTVAIIPPSEPSDDSIAPRSPVSDTHDDDDDDDAGGFESVPPLSAAGEGLLVASQTPGGGAADLRAGPSGSDELLTGEAILACLSPQGVSCVYPITHTHTHSLSLSGFHQPWQLSSFEAFQSGQLF